MAFEWKNKQDGVDDILAEDINNIANEVIRIGNEELAEINTTLDNIEAELDEIDGKLSSAFNFKGTKDYYSDLELIENPQSGDIWLVKYTGTTGTSPLNAMYVYTSENKWEEFGEGTAYSGGVGQAVENGGEIFNDYENNTASGEYSHAEGFGADATGDSSHAEGDSTEASGESSHAEGIETKASGDYSHAEGYLTRASGESSHAEGYDTMAISKKSHAEGYGTTAGCKGYYYSSINTVNDTITLSTVHSGTPKWDNNIKLGWNIGDIISIVAGSKYVNCAKITGINNNVISFEVLNLEYDKNIPKNTETIYKYANGFDDNTVYVLQKPHVGLVDIGWGAHAEGGSAEDDEITRAQGPFSHAEGRNTQAQGHYSHAEGRDTVSSGAMSHAEGQGTTSSGDRAHAEGRDTNAIGVSSHSEGYNTTASGDYSHSEGQSADAIGIASHAEGFDTQASGDYSHTEGYQSKTKENTKGAHAEGYRAQAYGDYSHAQGYYTIAKSQNQHAGGRWNLEDGSNKYAEIIGNGDEVKGRSNARTLDWDGNAWFAGDVLIGGTSQYDENAVSLKKVASVDFDNFVTNEKLDEALLGLDGGEVQVDLSNYYTKTETDAKLKDKAASSHKHTKSEITDFPTIPTVNNAMLTIQKNGTNVATFTANSATNATANITVPTKASDVGAVPTTRTVNGKPLSGNITLSAGDVGALPNTTNIPDSLSDLTSDSTHRTVTDTEKATWNSKSSFSGSYNDLTNIPSTFTPSTHNHDDKYYTKTATDTAIATAINERLDDIETALDNIIAIQNSLIGGDSV